MGQDRGMDGGTRLYVTLLGAFQVSRGAAVVPVSGARLRGLVVRLALAGGLPVGPGVLADAIWGADPPSDPAHALQNLVSRSRRALGSADAVTQLPGGYRLAVAGRDVDVLRFERLAADGRDRLRADDPDVAAAMLGEAMTLWGADPGADPSIIAAVAPATATRLALASIEAVTDLAEAELRLGRAATAVDRLKALLTGRPVDERAAALLMDALTAQGRQAEALAQYERIRETLADDLGADPGTALRERHLRLLRAPAGSGPETHPSTVESVDSVGEHPPHAGQPGLTPAREPHPPTVEDINSVGEHPPHTGQPGLTPAREPHPHTHTETTDLARERPPRGNRPAAEVARAKPSNPPPPATHQTARSQPSNLPAPLTSFIGRDDDLVRLDTLLANGRLVTVAGPGGAGKTRLAVEAARRHRHEYRDRVWMVDLASVAEPGKVGTALLAAIGLRGSALFEASAKLRGDPVGELDVLADQLGDGQSLLVVDNCEHLIDAAAHLVAALLARCAGLRVLATSREPLAIDGEALVPLGSLTLPEPDADVERARATAAVRLFTERAASLRPGFDIDEHNLGEVLRVVRGLDGLPLALELAAARLRTLSLADLAAGLADRFGLLTTGSRIALPRHRTLRAVIAWSWELLDADARTLAERISVLPGGVTPASAAAVCDGTTVPAAAIRELLAVLVDRSLLQLAPDTGRYRMLETIREYGRQRLTERDELTGARDLAARYLTELAERCDPMLRGPEQLDALQVLRAEYDNVLAALRHRRDIGDADGTVELAVVLSWYWQMLGLHTEATYWLGEAVALPPRRPGAQRDIAEGMLLLNTIAAHNAPAPEPTGELRALTDRLLSHPASPGLGGALIAVRLAARAKIEVPPTIMRRLIAGPDRWLAGQAHMFRAQSAENAGRLDQVRSDVSAALDCFDRTGDRWSTATALPLRALLRQYDGDLTGAVADLNRAKRLAHEFGSLSPSDEIYIELRWIDLQVRLGEPARAIELIDATRQRALRSASPQWAILLDVREADLRVRNGDLDRARELIESAETGLRDQVPFGGDHGRALLGAVRGSLCLALGDGPGAAKALGGAYAAASDSGDLPMVAAVAAVVAGQAARYGRFEDSAVILGAAARLRGAHDHTDPQVRTLSDRGRAALGDEGFTEAYRTGWQLDPTAALARADPARPPQATLPSMPAW